MKAYGGIDVFLTSALVGGEWSTSRPGRFIPGERAPEPIGWVGPRTGLDEVKRILDPTGTGTPTSLVVQPVASRYTDCAIPAPICVKICFNKHTLI
jgi:hypothetical protein